MATTKRRIIVILTLILLLATFAWYRQPAIVRTVGNVPTPTLYYGRLFNGTWDYQRDKDNLLLNQGECAQAFPALFDEIDRAKRDRQSRPITLKEIDSITPRNGYIRAMIYDQQLYVIATEGHIYSREIATLHSLHRALISSPEKVPNIEFAFNSDDRIESVALWGYARQEEDTNIWLIPDFGYWSWPETKAGSMKEVVMKAEWAEEAGALSWPKKVQKVLWRGATMGLELREKLIEVASSQPWADVKALNWKDHESMTSDLKSMSEHCEYKYLAHTEGNSYSGRLKYLQSCRSVIVAHEMAWIQHQHPLMRSSRPDQNFVTVKRDFSDLQDKIKWLQTHDEDAQRIANNNVKTFREQYLTEAAEVCYWRRLIEAWAEVSDFEPEFFKKEQGKKVWRGLPVETFLLERRLEWDPY
ncbi:Lipopolysaccharide-modifying protein [Penicillium cf. griseofulvum]|uniref:Lipopolysaccharide-modifying protein n=1 Tax=Penicillium cf. griseofulvum TaxID=2972120 RepID=A0A9W9MQX5_9EURO|nr:Lipopolysaccharide-modifying protein [Penicillium cf. griseofulvum]